MKNKILGFKKSDDDSSLAPSTAMDDTSSLGVGVEDLPELGDEDSSDDAGDTSHPYPSRREAVFLPGILKRAIQEEKPRQDVLSAEDYRTIGSTEKRLEQLLQQFTDSQASLKKIFLQPMREKNQAASSQSADRQRLIDSLKQLCESVRQKAWSLMESIATYAARLLKAQHFVDAGILFNKIVNYSSKFFGPGESQTLKFKLDYFISKLQASLLARFELDAQTAIENDLGNLQSVVTDLLKLPENPDNQRSVAIADYILAQYYVSKKNIPKATEHLDRSERLRKSYHACASDMDKIRYLRAIIAHANNQMEEAILLFTESYQFRCSIDQLGADLIPVLEMLVQLREYGVPDYRDTDMTNYLTHLLALQKRYNVRARDVVQTQIKLLRTLQFHTPDREYWEMMDAVVATLDRIEVTQESVEVAMQYYALADLRLHSLLPQEWSMVQKREYYADVLKLIHKANSHMRCADRNHPTVLEFYPLLETIEANCKRSIDCFSNLDIARDIAAYKAEPMHPDDIVEAQLEVESDEHPDPAAARALYMPRAAPIQLALQEVVAGSTTVRELLALSEFSSEVDYALVDADDVLLTVAEFNLLPEIGTLNPYRLRWAQAGIEREFRDQRFPQDWVKEQLVINPDYAKEIPPVEIGVHDNRVFSFDNRRLAVHMKAREENARVYIRYRKISGAHLQDRISRVYSRQPWNGLVVAERYAGKNSESIPYINPAFRSQLYATVQKAFKAYPSQRVEGMDDANGFPVSQAQAKKIYQFFQVRAQSGSRFATASLQKCSSIGSSMGKAAAFEFLIAQKKQFERENEDEDKQLTP